MRRVILMATCVAALVGLIVLMGDSSEANTDELLLDLLRTDGSAPVINRGGLPDGLEMDLPEAGRLIGSAEWPDYSRIVVSFEASPKEASTALVESLVSQGWELPPAKLYGFLPREIHGASLCREDREALSFSVEPAGSGASLAGMRYQKRLKKSPCLISSHLGFHNQDADIFPTLVAPKGARWWGGGGGGVGGWREPGDSYYEATVLESALSVPELLEHYAEQMKQAGWKLTDQLLGAGASVQFWVRSGGNGEEFFGTFVVLELSDGTVEVNLRVTLRRARNSA